METLLQDLGFCFRMLLRSPGFTAIVVIALTPHTQHILLQGEKTCLEPVP